MKEAFVLQIVIRGSTFMSVLGWVWGTPVHGEAAARIRMEKAGFGGDGGVKQPSTRKHKLGGVGKWQEEELHVLRQRKRGGVQGRSQGKV